MAKLNASQGRSSNANLLPVPAKRELPVSSYMSSKNMKPSVAELARSFALATAAKEGNEMAADDNNTNVVGRVGAPYELETATAFLEDLETYKEHLFVFISSVPFDFKLLVCHFSDEFAPCGVADIDLQDEALRPHYGGLPPLP